MDLPTIFITGFGPFGNVYVNASQKVVEKLTLLNLESNLDVKLYTEILDVSYDHVSTIIPQKWKALSPKVSNFLHDDFALVFLLKGNLLLYEMQHVL